MFAVRQMKRSRRQREDAWRRGGRGGHRRAKSKRRRSANLIRLSGISSAERCTFSVGRQRQRRRAAGISPTDAPWWPSVRLDSLVPSPSRFLSGQGWRPLTSALLLVMPDGPVPRLGPVEASTGTEEESSGPSFPRSHSNTAAAAVNHTLIAAVRQTSRGGYEAPAPESIGGISDHDG